MVLWLEVGPAWRGAELAESCRVLVLFIFVFVSFFFVFFSPVVLLSMFCGVFSMIYVLLVCLSSYSFS